MAGLVVSGGSVAMNNTSVVATAALSGGTITGGGRDGDRGHDFRWRHRHVTAGSVPTLDVVRKRPDAGRNRGRGASAGTMALSVSGGLVTLYNTNTIPAATLSGGTTTLAGPTVAAVSVSGSAMVSIGFADTVSGTTSISGGTRRDRSSGLGLAAKRGDREQQQQPCLQRHLGRAGRPVGVRESESPQFRADGRATTPTRATGAC